MLNALEAFNPDIILIEGPPDAEALIPLVLNAEMHPPVALLVYQPKQLELASFFPFAEFSPEWQAMRYGLENRAPVRFMDLPMSLAFPMRELNAGAAAQGAKKQESRDPFGEIARLAGYSDPERWWDALVERQGEGGIFPVILELMSALREGNLLPESRETLLREAFMRQRIRETQKEQYQKIAVVCGAWHTPALAVEQFSASADAAPLKGLKKVKTEATWIPWSFDRLAAQSGYSAGVVAPAWYRVLWETTRTAEEPVSNPVARWLTQVAHLLREKDLTVSPAHVIEAVRLAEGLATLRRTTLPGIEELREAAVAVLCGGSEKPLELIDRQLVTGEVLGAVPATLPQPPLKADFEAQARSCRLAKNTQEKTLELDLRQEAQLKKSRLLHRLQLLGVPWGRVSEVGAGKQGGFHEHWQLKWLPDYEIRLIEAGTWGNTVEEAATHKASRRTRDSEDLPELTQVLGIALKADLPVLVPAILSKISAISALAKDTLMLADSVLPLAEVLRYGSARKMNLNTVEQLLDQIVPRVCLQLPAACTAVAEDVAGEIARKILSVNRALGILRAAAHEAAWQKTLGQISDVQGVSPLLAGLAARLLFDKGLRTATQTGDAMHYHLSHAQAPAEAAQWIEGFLYGSGLLLLHQQELWQTLDRWVREMPDEHFIELLPLLRRSFSRFPDPERQKMLDLVKSGGQPKSAAVSATDWDSARAEGVLALTKKIFGTPASG
ncbi:MAG: hypothetical protein KDC65_02515 [Saprospiraceae bacterium]|nr:hypothetical protein [Saprospiraceae bacterium]